ncbi:unnamed protein product, partial [Musa hybrid cultivar]
LVALCLALTGVALAAPKFIIEGRIYCDTCRAGFQTAVSQYIQVKLQCRNYETDAVEHLVEGVTDNTGTYHIKVEDSHEEEICEVSLLQSPQPGCTEVAQSRNRARILVTGRSGLASDIRASSRTSRCNSVGCCCS